EPVHVEGVADQQADQRTDQRVRPEQRRAGQQAEEFSVPAFHGGILSPLLEGEGDELARTHRRAWLQCPPVGFNPIRWQRPCSRPIFPASTCATAARSATCSTCRAATATRSC